MLMTGQDYLDSIRDGRCVYIGGERVEDVTTHPAFRNAAHSFAMIYDRKRAAENRDVMVCEDEGDTFSTYFLLPHTREDLARRFETHRRIAAWTYGLIGRSPDNFPSYVSGLATDPALFDSIRQGFGDNIRSYHRHMRRNDIFVSHTVTNPQGWRPVNPAEPPRQSPTLRVVAEDDAGVTINGLKMLGTASVFCHETWCGNLQPLVPGQEKESITCAVPLNAPGVSIWSRKPFERYAVSEFDNPLAARFDESDSAVLFENVKVPWERVFCHDNVEMTRAIYMRTPGHAMANHQANVRFLEKLKLIVGIAARLAEMNNVGHVPAVQFALGKLAALEATLEGLIMGQINCGEAQVPGYHTVNRRYVYAALHWCTNHHAEICDMVRELMGAGVFQMPADASVLANAETREAFETYWSTPGWPAAARMKLTKLAWDLLGSDFAGRHNQYEKFYAGPSFVMNTYSYVTAPWKEWTGSVDALMASYDVPGAVS
ncbi:MAG TPA: 4-hydroxyphenylacetate 3-hydroxylase N-terminal domain-containing protein [Xanthobacteraceae bacterium]|nr:4-hydroxyphenylacetate 3-hydroxylase N-terminal domain-containing protein [Xanthobacteraceae bacterium]